MTIDDFDMNEISDKLAIREEESENQSPLLAYHDDGHDDASGGHNDLTNPPWHDDHTGGHNDGHYDISGFDDCCFNDCCHDDGVLPLQ